MDAPKDTRVTSFVRRAATLLVASALVAVTSSSGVVRTAADGQWEETRFQTGCHPGPSEDPPPPEHLETHYPALSTAALTATLRVDVNTPSERSPRPILGAGFNLEHALWSCPEFRTVLRPEILDPFMPAIARVDSGLLPAAPAELSAPELGPSVYQSMLSSAPYADSWSFLESLDRAGVKLVLGVWGGPAQFTDDGTRRGVLSPSHYDDYVTYVSSVVDFLVKQQHVNLWATTIANEPDGGDGNQIPPDGLAYIAHQLAPRLAADNVKFYGPDTSDGVDALQYLPPLLDDPVVVDNLAFVGFHQYDATSDVGAVVDYVHARQPSLPVIVTEYTSFGFGDLDAGQEANAQNGFGLDIANTVLSHYREGVDAAVYWDAVDYLQPGHDAITRWGILRGPADDFTERPRYYALQQILPYLQPGARVLDLEQDGGDTLSSLAVQTAQGAPVVFLVNQEFRPIDLELHLTGADAGRFSALVVTVTDRTHHAERLGRVALQDGLGQLTLAPRSVTTLAPAGSGLFPN
jgi:O-glycosyl hydrolase